MDAMLKASCSTSIRGRIIERHEFAESLERNKRAQEERPEIYKQRQSIVEHPFGTMKRQWGFDHIMTKKTMKHASADVGFIFIAYNLRRLLTLIGITGLIALFLRFIGLCVSVMAEMMQIRPIMTNQGTLVISIRKSLKLGLSPIFR